MFLSKKSLSVTKYLSTKGISALSALIVALTVSCNKDDGQGHDVPKGDDTPEEVIVLDINFHNEARLNPLDFGAPGTSRQTAEGEIYEFESHPITICKGRQEGARYYYSSDGGYLGFEKANGWIALPAITGWQLQSVTYEHGNSSVKRMVVKTSLDPSVTIAYTSSDDSCVASEDGSSPDTETLPFYSNGIAVSGVTGEPAAGSQTFLQFIGADTHIYRIKAVYMRSLPPVPGPAEDEVTGFPKVTITTADAAPIVSKDNYVSGSFEYSDPCGINPGERSVIETDVARFRGRGNTTWTRHPKKPYKIKFDGKQSFFGLDKDKEWVLLANYSDKSLLRNSVAMKISSILGFGWTPALYPVELWLNGRYDGVYLLGEHKKVSSSRINITTEEDGGRDMYLEFDLLMDETTCFQTERFSIPVMFSDPEIPSDEMLDETKEWFRNFENTLASENFADPVTGYSAYIDVPSFIDHYIIQELSKNVDGRMTKGAFVTRTMGGPLRIYHEWDFDLAFGNDKAISTLPGVDSGPTGFMIRDFTGNSRGKGWYPTLFRDPLFAEAVRKRWDEVYPQLQEIPAFIDAQAAVLRDAADRNFQRWHILGAYVWPNVIWPESYEEELDYLKKFYSERLEWLDKNL